MKVPRRQSDSTGESHRGMGGVVVAAPGHQVVDLQPVSRPAGLHGEEITGELVDVVLSVRLVERTDE